ncbi:MAG: hypothetical protein JSV60_01970, partial [Desulfobacterales bacterium]
LPAILIETWKKASHIPARIPFYIFYHPMTQSTPGTDIQMLRTPVVLPTPGFCGIAMSVSHVH